MGNQSLLRACVFIGAVTGAAAHASVARLTLNGLPGDHVSAGQVIDVTYSSVDPLLIWNEAQIFNLGGSPQASLTDYIQFLFLRDPFLAPYEYATLTFSSRGLGTALVEGHYEDAERASFASVGHPGIDVTYGHRGCNQIAGSFEIDEIRFGTGFLQTFSASFSQSCDLGPLVTGTFYYDATATSIPEPSTLLLVALGFGGVLLRKVRLGYADPSSR